MLDYLCSDDVHLTEFSYMPSVQRPNTDPVEPVTFEQPTASVEPAPPLADGPLTTALRDSAALRRLMEEVRCELADGLSAAVYDRVHNRHNR